MAWLQREEWLAPAPKAALQRMSLPVSTVFLHHTVTSVSSDAKADFRKVTNYSKYIDVPYTVMVHPDGTIATGRYLNGVPALGAHTAGKNSVSLGVAVLGNYVNDQPTPAALDSIVTVLEAFVSKGYITAQFVLKSHSDAPYATACCGTNLKAKIASILGYVGFDGPVVPVYTPVPVPQKPQVPVNNYPAYPMLLKRGSRNVYVRQAQAKLHDRGWNISVDGDFGPNTEKVVKQFQAEKGLVADGVIGPKTWKAIFTSPVT